MKEKRYRIEELGEAARWLLEAVGTRHVVLFDAAMGVGKTTIIAEIARQLGASDEANSPTFSIVNEYALPEHKAIYHFDFYRLDDPRAVADIGIRDYVESGNLCVMEWPKVALPFLPEDSVVVRIETNDDGSRTMMVMN